LLYNSKVKWNEFMEKEVYLLKGNSFYPKLVLSCYCLQPLVLTPWSLSGSRLPFRITSRSGLHIFHLLTSWKVITRKLGHKWKSFLLLEIQIFEFKQSKIFFLIFISSLIDSAREAPAASGVLPKALGLLLEVSG